MIENWRWVTKGVWEFHGSHNGKVIETVRLFPKTFYEDHFVSGSCRGDARIRGLTMGSIFALPEGCKRGVLEVDRVAPVAAGKGSGEMIASQDLHWAKIEGSDDGN